MFLVDTCTGGGERCFFSPSKSQWCRLKTVTFSNFVACINSTIVIPEIYQQRMLHALLCCKQAMPPSKCLAVNKSALLLPLTRVSGKKPPAWRKYIKCDSFIPQEIPPSPHLQGGFFVTCIPDDFCLTCVFVLPLNRLGTSRYTRVASGIHLLALPVPLLNPVVSGTALAVPLGLVVLCILLLASSACPPLGLHLRGSSII